MQEHQDHYKILGIEKNATEDEIKKAYRKRSLETHPDKTLKDTNREFRAVCRAYQVLKNESEKNLYDAQLNRKTAHDKGLSSMDSPVFYSDSSGMNYDALYKFMFMGGIGTFKEEIIKTAAGDFNPALARSTIVVDMNKIIKKKIDGIGNIILQLWCTGDQIGGPGRKATESYCRNTDVFVLPLNVTEEKCWKDCSEVFRLYKRGGFFDDSIVSLVLVHSGSKEKVITDETIQAFCDEFGITDKIDFRMTPDRKANFEAVSKLLETLAIKCYQKEYSDVLKSNTHPELQITDGSNETRIFQPEGFSSNCRQLK